MKKKILHTAIASSLSIFMLAQAPAIFADGQTTENVLENLNQAKIKKEELRAQKIFDASLKEQLPMSPHQIKKFKIAADQSQAAIRSEIPPNMKNTSRRISIEPGAKSPLVLTHPGYVTTILFVDSTGMAWPITSHTAGQPTWYSVNRPEIKPGNMITISPLSNHVNTNLLVTLEGLATPIVLRVETNFDAKSEKPNDVDSLVTFRLEKPGPNAEIQIIGKPMPSALDKATLDFLNDTPPSSARSVHFSPAQSGVSGWHYNNKLYLRSIYPAKWPAHWNITSGSGDLRVYEMPITSSIILFVNGRSTSFLITEGK